MPAITIRNIPSETHTALKQLAAAHGKSTEAEVRSIIEQAVRPINRVKLGSLLASIGQKVGGVDLDIERDVTNTEPVDLK